MFTSLDNELCRGIAFEIVSSNSQAYQEARKRDLKEIKQILKDNPDVEMHYYNGWTKIGDKTFNGITEEFLKKFANKYCMFANKMI